MTLTLLTVLASDPVPTTAEVKAGWAALAIFIGMAVAVAFLGWNLAKQLRKTKANADAGVFDEPSETVDSEN